MQPSDFYAKYLPYARMVESATQIPAELEVAFWSWETDFATNQTYKVNNMAGISAPSPGKDFKSGGYAGYNSLEHFVADRIRMLKGTNYGYPAILAAAAAHAGYEAITRAHNASGWSVDDYSVSTIVSRAKSAAGIAGKPQPPKVCPTCHLPVPRH